MGGPPQGRCWPGLHPWAAAAAAAAAAGGGCHAAPAGACAGGGEQSVGSARTGGAAAGAAARGPKGIDRQQGQAEAPGHRGMTWAGPSAPRRPDAPAGSGTHAVLAWWVAVACHSGCDAQSSPSCRRCVSACHLWEGLFGGEGCSSRCWADADSAGSCHWHPVLTQQGPAASSHRAHCNTQTLDPSICPAAPSSIRLVRFRGLARAPSSASRPHMCRPQAMHFVAVPLGAPARLQMTARLNWQAAGMRSNCKGRTKPAHLPGGAGKGLDWLRAGSAAGAGFSALPAWGTGCTESAAPRSGQGLCCTCGWCCAWAAGTGGGAPRCRSSACSRGHSCASAAGGGALAG